MNENTFWNIIESTQSADQAEQASRFQSELRSLSKHDLVTFHKIYQQKLSQAHTWKLWGGAYVINGGCSDDGFDYFKDWLISRGAKVFEDALNDPETLIGKAIPWETEFEEFRYYMSDVMEESHNEEFPKENWIPHHEPSGAEWSEEDVEGIFPKLIKWVNSQTPVFETNIRQDATQPNFWQRLFGKK